MPAHPGGLTPHGVEQRQGVLGLAVRQPHACQRQVLVVALIFDLRAGVVPCRPARRRFEVAGVQGSARLCRADERADRRAVERLGDLPGLLQKRCCLAGLAPRGQHERQQCAGQPQRVGNAAALREGNRLTEQPLRPGEIVLLIVHDSQRQHDGTERRDACRHLASRQPHRRLAAGPRLPQITGHQVEPGKIVLRVKRQVVVVDGAGLLQRGFVGGLCSGYVAAQEVQVGGGVGDAHPVHADQRVAAGLRLCVERHPARDLAAITG